MRGILTGFFSLPLRKIAYFRSRFSDKFFFFLNENFFAWQSQIYTFFAYNFFDIHSFIRLIVTPAVLT